MSGNQLAGAIPPALLSIRRLSWVSLGGNPGLTGCRPTAHYMWLDDDPDTEPPVCPEEPLAELCESGTAVPDPAHNPALVADCAVLLTIRDPLAGEAVLDWDADRPITTWEGITIGGDPPRVVALALPSRGLRGHLPPRLGRLHGLRELRLGDNRLSSPIPFELRALDSLESLELHGNELIGRIPAVLGGLPRLESLTLHDNRLRGPIPATLTYASTLERLSLGSNAGLSGCILPALQEVAENDLADLGLPVCPPPIPPGEACENGTAVPNPADNPGLVSDCVALITAKRAFVSDVPLNWEAGRPITEWEGVSIGGEPGRVHGLSLEGRGLAGHIPPGLGGLTELRDLSLRSNALFGPIPAELGDLRTLQSLNLRSNWLTGPIPPELGGLLVLQSLDLSHNRLAGPFRPSWGLSVAWESYRCRGTS